jgi:hypothetical protein
MSSRKHLGESFPRERESRLNLSNKWCTATREDYCDDDDEVEVVVEGAIVGSTLIMAFCSFTCYRNPIMRVCIPSTTQASEVRWRTAAGPAFKGHSDRTVGDQQQGSQKPAEHRQSINPTNKVQQSEIASTASVHTRWNISQGKQIAVLSTYLLTVEQSSHMKKKPVA